MTTATQEKAAQAVRVPARLYAITRTWPDLLDRIRHRAPDLLSLGQGSESVTVRTVFGVLPTPQSDGDDVPVPVPADIWALVRGWLPVLLVARYRGIFSYDELARIAEAERRFAELEALA